MNIKKYKTKDGKTKYKFNAYLGKDPLTGKEIRTNRAGFDSKKDAEIAYVKLINQGFIRKKSTFEDVYNEWFEIYKTTVKDTTILKTKGFFVDHILPIFGKKRIDRITIQQVQKFIIKKSQELKGYKMLNTYMSQVFKYAISHQYANNNPCLNVIYPRIIKNDDKKIHYWNKKQVKIFLDFIKDKKEYKWYAFFRLLIYTGVRKGEALALTWNDIDFKNKRININKTLSLDVNHKKIITTPKTKNSNRIIFIDDHNLSILKKHKLHQGPSNLLFTDQNNGYLNSTYVSNVMYGIIRKAKLPKIAVHDLRHTHASLCFESGMTIKEVQQRLGHSNIRTTADIYVHLTQKKEQQSFNKFINFMNT